MDFRKLIIPRLALLPAFAISTACALPGGRPGIQYPPLRGAMAGDVIQLPAGVFAYQLDVPEGVTLRGAGAEATILEGDDSWDYIVRLASRSRLENVTLKGGRVAIRADFADAFSIRNCRVLGPREAGVLASDSSGIVQSCEFDGMGVGRSGVQLRNTALEVADFRMSGWLTGIVNDPAMPSRLSVLETTVRNGAWGMNLRGAEVRLRQVVIEDCSKGGLFLAGEGSAEIEDSRFARCAGPGVQIGLGDETRAIFRRCVFEENAGSGLALQYGERAGPLRNAIALEDCLLRSNGRFGVGLHGKDGQTQSDAGVRYPLTLIRCDLTGNRSGGISPGTIVAPLVAAAPEGAS